MVITRYRIDNEGYITEVFFNFYVGDCCEYIGEIPSEYETLQEWAENANIQAYKIVDNNLVYDENKDNELKRKFETETEENSTATHKWVCDKFGKINSVYDDELSIKIDGSSLFTLNNAKESEFVSLQLTPNERITGDLRINISNENMLENKSLTQTIGGIKFEVNNDRTITLNGTSTETIEFVLNGSLTSEDVLFFLKNNTKYMKGGLPSNVGMNLYYYDGTDRELISSGSNGTLNFTETKYITCVSLTIASGKTFKDVKVSPMITIGEYRETPYVEHKGNDLLTFDLGSYTFKNKDYILIERERLYFYTNVGLYPNINLKAGKNVFPTKERLEIINAIIDSLTSYEGLTIIQCDKDINFSVRYFTKDYLNERFAKIETEQGKIALEVGSKASTTDLNNAVSDLSDEITTTANTINSNVSETYATKTDLSNNVKDINAKLELKVNEKDLVSEINASADVINLEGNRFIVKANNFELTADGTVTATAGDIGGFELGTNKFEAKIYADYDYTDGDLTTVKNIIMNETTPTAAQLAKYDLDGDGKITSVDHVLLRKVIQSGVTTTKNGSLKFNTNKAKSAMELIDGNGKVVTFIDIWNSLFDRLNANEGYITNLSTDNFTNNSDARLKEDIKELEDNYINLLKQINPVSFKYKSTGSEHIGFIAQEVVEALENNNLPQIPVKQDELGFYSLNYLDFIGVLWKTNQNLIKRVETLEKEIDISKKESGK